MTEVPADILAKARAHSDRLANQSIHIPEWDETIYFDPISLRDRKQLRAEATRGKKTDFELMEVLAVIAKAKREDGTPAFAKDQDTIDALLNLNDPAPIGRLAKAILAITAEDDLGE